MYIPKQIKGVDVYELFPYTQLYTHDSIQKTTRENLTGIKVCIYTFVSLLHNHIFHTIKIVSSILKTTEFIHYTTTNTV